MDSFDLNTRLPPRKRLLAGLKKGGLEWDSPPPVPLTPLDFHPRSLDLLNSAAASPEDIIEASRSAALAAAEAAARARTTAVEKAALAAKARVAAREALELLDSVSRNEARGGGCLTRSRSKKKHVPIKLLYKNNRPVKCRESDEDVARRLHHSMNSSPRFSTAPRRKNRGSGTEVVSDGSVVCNSNSPVFIDEGVFSGGYAGGKDGLSKRGFVGGKKARVKRKKLALSECNARDQEKPGGVTVNEEINSDAVKRNIPLINTANPSGKRAVSLKITPVLKCKKFKVSQLSSGSKISRTLYSNPSATNSSAMVEVD